MAVDFDFDTSYNDDEENDPLDEEFPEEEELENDNNEAVEKDYDDEDGGEPKKSNPLRLILLVLLILVLLCAACYLLTRFVPIPGFGGAAPPPARPAPAQDTPTPATVDQGSSNTDGAVSGESTDGTTDTGAAEQPGDEGAPAEGSQDGAAVAGGESADQGQNNNDAAGSESADSGATGDAGAVDEATKSGEAGTDSATAEPTDEGIIISTPVPGPTATPGGENADTGAEAVQSCDNNVPPTAGTDGPYEAMMGKGQAIVNFDGAESNDTDGIIELFEWDFGDGNTGNGLTVQHGYTMTGTFKVTLTVTDNCGATANDTTDAVIRAATPPSGTVTATPPPVSSTPAPPDNGGVAPVLPPVDPALGTAGFCYKVRPGNTLSGIAGSFGVPVLDLAFVNGVSPEYYVIAGQGLFIPVQEINPRGPNIYPAQSGDTLQSIADQCGIPAHELAHVNGIGPNSPLGPGQLVRIPPPWSY